MTASVLSGIDPASLPPLFDLDDAGLAAHHAVRRLADSARGFPCRVSLRDAAVGEELPRVPHWHPPAASPYRVCAPVFIRRGAMPARLAANEVPPHVAHRLLSVRACDPADCRVAAEVRGGRAGGGGWAASWTTRASRRRTCTTPGMAATCAMPGMPARIRALS
ncbi:MAG: DUF1203 domain-containing protein [Stenotrophomonas acidaminiphila]